MSFVWRPLFSFEIFSFIRSLVFRSKSFLCFQSSFSFQTLSFSSKSFLRFQSTFSFQILSWYLNSSLFVSNPLFRFEPSFRFKSFLLVGSLVFRSKLRLVCLKPHLPLEVSSVVAGWLDASAWTLALVSSPLFRLKSCLSFEIIFFENFCLFFEVLSSRFKCFLFVWSHVFRLKTTLFVRNLLFHSKPCLSFKVIYLFPIFFAVSNPFFLFEIPSPFSIYFFVSNPFMIFEIVSFRFKSSLSFRALFPFQVLSSSWKSCLSFEATSCLLEATSSFRSLLCCGWLAGRKRMDPCFGFKSSLSIEIMFSFEIIFSKTFVSYSKFFLFVSNAFFSFEVMSFVWRPLFSFEIFSFIRSLVFRSKSFLCFQSSFSFQTLSFCSKSFLRFQSTFSFQILSWYLNSSLFVSNPLFRFEPSFRFKSFLLVGSLVFRSKLRLVCLKPHLPLEVSSVVAGWLDASAWTLALVSSPLFRLKSCLSFEIIFFENFCFLFEVLSFRFKCFLFVWSHVFRLKTTLFVRNLLFHSKPCLSFKVISLFPIFFAVSNPFFLFEILSPFSIYFFVSNPFMIFELASFRFKSSLSFRALLPFQVLSSIVGSLVFRSKPRLVCWKPHLPLEVSSVVAGWLDASAWTLALVSSPLFRLKSFFSKTFVSYSKFFLFVSNAFFSFEVMSFVWRPLFSFEIFSFIRSLVFRSKSFLCFQSSFSFQTLSFCSKSFLRFQSTFSFQILSWYLKSSLFVSNPLFRFEPSFRFKSFLLWFEVLSFVRSHVLFAWSHIFL